MARLARSCILCRMETQQRFCLKWNQFNQNIKDVFNELREGRDLFDVTLACEDGTHVGAHRIILAACSSFFRGLFTVNSHPHPWIYLKGITSLELNAVIDFMYQGEVNVPQDNLSQFLATAEDLKVKGLSGYGGQFGGGGGDGGGQLSDFGEAGAQQQQQLIIGSSWGNELQEENKESDILNTMKREYNNEFNEDIQGYNESLVIVEEEPNVINEKIIEVNAELDKQIEENLIKSNGAWTCKVCGKFANHKSKLKQHVETHINGFSHPCGLCGKSYRSRNVLRMHMSRDHKNKSQNKTNSC